MKVTILLRFWSLLLTIALLLGAGQTVSAAPVAQNGGVPILQAIQNGQLEVKVTPNPNGMGFREKILVLEMESKTGGPLEVFIPKGTQYQNTAQQGYAILIQAEDIEIRVSDEIRAEVNAFSLNYEGFFPSGMDETQYYEIGAPVTDSKLLELLDTINAGGHTGSYGAQVAVWSKISRIPPDELNKLFKMPLGNDDIALAQKILDLKLSVTEESEKPQGPVQGDSNPTAPEKGNDDRKGGGALLYVVGAVAALVIGMALVFSLRGNKNATAEREEPAKPPVDPVSPPGGKQRLRLSVISGPLASRDLELDLPVILSRESLVIQVIEDPSLSIPHAALDVYEAPFRIKDLNSQSGVWLGNVRLEDDWGQWSMGTKARLGSLVLTAVDSGALVHRQNTQINKINTAESLVIVTGKPVTVFTVGDDGNISDAHVLLFQRAKDIIARDLNSRNHTFVNGVRITAETVLKRGDHVKIGQTEFEVHL